MSIKNIIRAWKDEDYRAQPERGRAGLLPKHPAGLIELSGAEMDGIDGGSLQPYSHSLARSTCQPCFM